MIVFHHFDIHGTYHEWDYSSFLPLLWHKFIYTGGKIGVDIFVLISGYFLVNSKNSVATNSKKILRIWGQLVFYSISIYIVLGLMKINDWGVESFLKTFFPVKSSVWWFASTYFVLFLLHPFLNILIHSLDKRKYQALLILLLVCWCIIPTFFKSEYAGNSLSWFVTLYLMAGYIRIYGLNPIFTRKHYLILFGFVSIITYILGIAFSVLCKKWSGVSSFIPNLYGQNNLPVLLISMTLFLVFAKLKIRYHKWINVVASATFGVYLLHDHYLIRIVLWKQIFNNSLYQDSLIFIPYSIVVVAIVYIVCTVIDLVRQQIFERPYMMFINRYINVWLKSIEKMYSHVKQIIFG